MATGFEFSVLTQTRTLLADEASSIVAPGTEGYLEIWAHHAPLLAELTPGRLTIRDVSGREAQYAVSGGFLEVSWEAVTILVDAIEETTEIDFERARASADRARRRLGESPDDIDVGRAVASLARALNRMGLATPPRDSGPS